MRLIFGLILLCASANSALASEQETAKQWLEKLSNSLRTLNFTTSFVVVKNNQAEPYHWFHGVNDEGSELEILSLLNGPRKDILRRDDIVSYISPGSPPYSIKTNYISSPIPSALRNDFNLLMDFYDVVSVGRSRVLGRLAQLIRIEPKDENRYGYWLWLDQYSNLLLKLAIVSGQGEMLEQVQFTHLDITPEPSNSLLNLQSAEFPAVIELPNSFYENEMLWKVNWLPDGFKEIRSNKHDLSLTKTMVDFRLFSDGLVDISVYVNSTPQKKRAVEHIKDGATVVLNQVENGIEVSVLGKIPPVTAKAIADSITFKAPISPHD